MVHWPINNNSIIGFEQVTDDKVPSTKKAFEELKKLQKAGKIKHIGVSNFNVAQMQEAMACGVKIAVN